jgi:hypothetical protein
MTNATTCDRLKAVPATRTGVNACQGRTVWKSPDHSTRARFCSAVDRPTVVKIYTLCEAWMTPCMTST